MEEGSPPVALCSPKAENVQEQSEQRNIAGGDTVGSIQIEKTDSTNKPSPDSCSDSFDERKGGSGTSSNPATTSEGVEATDSGVKASFDDDTDVQDEEMVLRWDDDELVISEKKSVDSDNLADIECDMEMSCVIKDTSNDGINIGITSSLEPNEYTKSPEKLLHDVSNTGAIDPAATGSRNMLSDLKHDEVKPTLTEDSSAKNDCITAVSNKMETDTTETELGKQDIIVEHLSVNRASQNTENNLTIKENSPTASETIEINKDPVLQLKQDEQNPNSNVISSAEDSMISAPDIQSEKLDPELSIVQDEIIKSPVQDLGKSVLSAAETTDPEKKETENSVTGQVLDIKSPALHQSSDDIPCVSENIEAEKMDVDLNDFDKDSLNVEEKVLAVSDVATKIDSLDSIESKIVNVLNIEDNIKSPEERGPLPENTSLNEATESELLKSPDTSIFNASIEPNLDHKLKNPDVMIEIPTQEMIDYEDSELSFNLNLTSSVESTELDNDNEDIENIKENVDNILDSLGKDSVFDSKNIVEEVGEKEIMSELKDDSISKNINKAETNIEAGNDEIYVSIATNIPTEVSVASNIDLPEISETNTLNIEPQEMDIQETETKVDAELSIAVIDAITLEPEPSTSKDVKTVEESDAEMNERSEELKEGTKMQDSLGLLAESSRVMEDDDEAEDDDEDGDGDGGDDDDDFEPDDESSNQMTAEHSEDSNAQQSDTDKQTDTQTPGQAGDEVMMDTLDAESKEADAGSEIVIEDEVVCEDVDISEQTIQLDIESVPEIQTVDEKATPKVESATEKAAVTVSDSNTDSAVKFSLLESLLLRSKDGKEDTSVKTDKPLKMNVVNLEDSSEDDIQEVKKSAIVEKSDTKEEAGDIPKESSESTVSRPRLGLEVFSLDSDEEDTPPAREAPPESVPRRFRCVTAACARRAGGARRLCVECDVRLAGRQASMVSDAMSCTPLLQFLGPEPSSLVEISSSEESETEEPPPLGADAARVLEEQLADMLNSTWRKYNLEERLAEAVKDITEDLELLEKETQTLDGILDSCQKLTDQLRGDLYATFEPRRQQLPAVIIADTKDSEYTCYESVIENSNERRSMRRRGRTPLEPKDTSIEKMDDDNQDVSVVQLSAEAPPPDLPPAGLAAPPLAEPLAGVSLLALRSAAGAWARAALLQIVSQNGTKMYRVRFGDQRTGKVFTLPGRCVAYIDPPAARLTIGTRIVALFKDIARAGKRETFYAGIVAEIPNPVNKYRYLVFFDDGYAQYVPHGATRLVLHAAAPVWDEVHPYSRQFVREYLMAYPERAMVRMHKGQNLQCEWNGKWWACSVLDVDASLVHVQFLEDGRHEWIYRGSTRLQPLYRERHAAPRRAARRPAKANMPYVEYTRSDEQGARAAGQTPQSEESLRKQRAVAKKSTALPATPATPTGNLDAVTSRVVYYTPKNAVKPHKFVPHTCSPKCRRTDVLSLCELRTYNPLAKPLLSGWQRQVVRFKGHKEVMYVSPCGRRLRSARELHRYLRVTGSELGVDLFAFGASTHCLAEFVLNKCLVAKKDLSHGKENVPVPCVNYYDSTLPEFCSYSTKRAPTAGVPLNLDPGFLCGCDCTDDCQDKSKCACWQMTLEGARTIGLSSHVGYVYRRLPEPLPTGIYECNVRCKCKQTCLNRVAQHPLQLKLQVFKTLNRGWGIRALNDVPKGSFLCVYAGNLLTDATANLDGLNEGDEYLAELDYIEVVEQMKEGYEDDVPDADKERGSDQSSSPSSASEPEERGDADGDFVLPDKTKFRHIEFNKRLRKREKRKTKEDTKKEKDDKTDKDKTSDTKEKRDEDCITISDDEEAREPARFAAEPGMASNEFVSKYRSLRSYFGKDEACYIMDAKVQGNIGRYLNHSCTPNVFVQNVFVDTHDPRFPWVAFFALHAVRAGTELTWNYNYDVGSVPGKVLYCYCGAPNCRGRLL